MKRILALLTALALLASLCACGKAVSGQEPAAPSANGPRPDPKEVTPVERPAVERAQSMPASSGRYRRVTISPDNWREYFELREIPLYEVTGEDVIATVFQTYCVTLREEYLPDLKPGGSYAVNFKFRFDLYIDTLDIDTNARLYRHTDDLFYAVQADKSATFDRYALPGSAYGADRSEYGGYRNAFFTGYAMLHAESKVWSGFYIDLDKVELLEASGYLELGG